MATDPQITANRENAKASTGPRSAEGKQATSKNAVRHGLTASSIDQFPAHIQEQFLDFRENLITGFAPGSAHEVLLFEHYAFAQFLYVRAQALHSTALEQSLVNPADRDAFTHLTRVARYSRGLERSAAHALALLHDSYADRCAAVELQDQVTHQYNSSVIIPDAAPVSKMLNDKQYRTSAEQAALRITYIEQGRINRERNKANPTNEKSPS
jgi:hypothetical protein